MRWILHIILLFLVPRLCSAQYSRYTVQIDIQDAYISGICIMVDEDETIKASIFNEFGISTFGYEYHKKKERVKITQIGATINRWFIKRQLKKDLRSVMKQLPNKVVFENKKYKLKYTFTPLKNDTSE